MNDILHDLARHNTWATCQLIRFCERLDEAVITTMIPGTYGSILETFRHIIDAELLYLSRITDRWPELPWTPGDSASLETLYVRAGMLGAALEAIVACGGGTEGTFRNDAGEPFTAPASIFLAQVLYHSGEHRAQIGTILGTLGQEPPSVSVWEYAFATGRTSLGVLS